ncbi:hypothetical protein [Streptomyces sp. ML-6]|uniref:hypothetical protein n=1 Tax=Streptomyces sp. ML-6 TaxID=2982693 RepID=UPI0024BFC5F4|nr:hypothetical protein [Streptomyces sp. ML-6]MDK0524851.1 hypothetical protein [Streptomyces sp. ML-6]
MAIMATCPHVGPTDDPHAGLIDEMTDDDNRRGPEPDETEFHQLVGRLVAVGDDQARAAGRRVRRTYAEMLPGPYDRQPVLYMAPSIVFETSEQARGYAA